MDSKQRLLDVNIRQKAFYDSRLEAGPVGNPAASPATRVWTRLRRGLQRSERHSGVTEAIVERHRAWLGDLSGKDVLDLGCYAGNGLSLEMARSARSYLGLDLSARAVEKLQSRLTGIAGAQAKAADFLAEDYRARFDVIYAYGVLHHFQDFDLLCARLNRALRPGGMVVSIDPLQSDPMNRLARLLYRPFQSDRDWEWPFDGRSFATLRRHFAIEAVQGFRGFSKLGLLAGPWGTPLARWGHGLDLRLAGRFGLPLKLCWVVGLKLRRPGGTAAED